MIETMCTFPRRDELIVAYLYDDIEAAERAAFETHLRGCARCRQELVGLRGVRSTLAAWAPPEPVRPDAAGQGPRQAERSWWREMPVWAQAAAALLFVGAAAGMANLDVRRDGSGLTVHTGWSTRPAVAPERAAPPATDPPWRDDLTALESRLRAELRAVPPAAPAGVAMSSAALHREVRAQLDESERRQQRELALRLAEVLKDVGAQRQADLVRIDRSLGFIQSNTYEWQMKQREFNNLVLKVSQKQQ